MSPQRKFSTCKSLSKKFDIYNNLSSRMSETLFDIIIMWSCDICFSVNFILQFMLKATKLAGGDVSKKLLINLIDSDCDQLNSSVTEQVLFRLPLLKVGILASSRHRGSAENVHNCKSKKIGQVAWVSMVDPFVFGLQRYFEKF